MSISGFVFMISDAKTLWGKPHEASLTVGGDDASSQSENHTVLHDLQQATKYISRLFPDFYGNIEGVF